MLPWVIAEELGVDYEDVEKSFALKALGGNESKGSIYFNSSIFAAASQEGVGGRRKRRNNPMHSGRGRAAGRSPLGFGGRPSPLLGLEPYPSTSC